MTTPYEELFFCNSAIALLDYWFSIKKADQLCPSKRDFSPMMMKAALPDIFLTEQHNPNHAELRVSGTNIREITGADQTGANIYDICKPSQARTLKALYAKVAEGQHAAISEHVILNQYGRKHAKALHLPLMCKQGEICYVVGVAKAMNITKFDRQSIMRIAEEADGMSVTYVALSDIDRAKIMAPRLMRRGA